MFWDYAAAALRPCSPDFSGFFQRKLFYWIMPYFFPLFIPCQSQRMNYPDLTDTVAADMTAIPETGISLIR